MEKLRKLLIEKIKATAADIGNQHLYVAREAITNLITERSTILMHLMFGMYITYEVGCLFNMDIHAFHF